MMFNLVNCKLWRKQMLSFINKQIYEKTSPFFGRLPASTHQSDSNICIGQHSQCNKRATHNIKIACINHRWVYSGFPVIWLVVFFMAWYKCDIFTFLPYAISVTYNSFFFSTLKLQLVILTTFGRQLPSLKSTPVSNGNHAEKRNIGSDS